MNGVGLWILGNTQWLYTRVIETRVFFLDLWSYPHFLSGVALFTVLAASRVRARRTWLFALLLAYELLELLFIYLAFDAFRPETLKDQGTDLAVGLLGALFASLTLQGAARRTVRGDEVDRYAALVCSALASLTLAFTWVGSYQYRYNHETLNSRGLNWWAFTLWAGGLFMLLQIFEALRRRQGGLAAGLAPLALAYFPALAAVEYLGYAVLGIHETSGEPGNALIFGIIHGTPALHCAYVLAPAIAVATHLCFRALMAAALGGVAAKARGQPDPGRLRAGRGMGRAPAAPSEPAVGGAAQVAGRATASTLPSGSAK